MAAKEFSMPPEEWREPEKSNKTRIIVALAAVAVLAAIGMALFTCAQSGDSWFDSGSAQGGYTPEDLDRIVEEGMMNISIKASITFEDGASAGEARITNIEANKRDQKITIALDDTGETVYESGAIPPGSWVEYITLDTDLPAGTYAATATFTGYDTETHDEKGRAAAQIKLVVLN